MRQFGNVDQTVLVHAEIDKSAEVGDVGHAAFELHAFLQVGDFPHVLAKLRHNELIARIASRFQKLVTNISDRIPAGFGFEAFEVDGMGMRRILD